jgi:hypothetical protein
MDSCVIISSRSTLSFAKHTSFFQRGRILAQFQSYAADGKEIECGEPIYGQYVQKISSL